MTPEAWAALGRGLGDGRVSIFSCPGWVTDDGTVVESRLASPAEWRSIDACVQEGWADLECHGYTHMDPDLESWTSAPDRLEDPSWYREMWPPRRAEEPGVADQRRVIASWQEHCGRGTALVAPGEAWGLNTVRAAADIDSEVERLRAAGASFRNDVIQGPGGKQVLLQDPSGNVVELFQPAA